MSQAGAVGQGVMQAWILAALAAAVAQPEWREVVAAGARPAGNLQAMGDFDGDRRLDKAVLVSNATRRRYAVEIRLASGHRFRVAEGDLRDIGQVGLSTALRGTYRTACGKGYGACAKGEPALVALRHAGVEVSYFEKASALYYWTGKDFAEVWTSD